MKCCPKCGYELKESLIRKTVDYNCLRCGRGFKVMENGELRKELGTKGTEQVKKYDWNRLIPEYEKAYQSVFGHNK